MAGPTAPVAAADLRLGGSLASEHKAVFHASLMKLFNDHTIMGMPLFPGAGFVEMALAAAAVKLRRQSKAVAGVELQGVSFLEPLA